MVSDVTLALAQAREPAMVNIPCHKKPPCFLFWIRVLGGPVIVLARNSCRGRSLAAFCRTFLAGRDGCWLLKFPQFSERDVAADLVTRFLFKQRGFG